LARGGFPLERWAARRGFELVAGADEVGRGALAGPLVAAAVLFPTESLMEDVFLLGILGDSKGMTPMARVKAAREILKRALDWSVVFVPPWEVDEKGIQECNREALAEALLALRPRPELAVVDYLSPRSFGEFPLPHLELVRGEEKSAAVAAASILAKVCRDGTMINLSLLYPGYGWERNKGYGTQDHWAAMREKGVTPLHRLSYRGVGQLSLG